VHSKQLQLSDETFKLNSSSPSSDITLSSGICWDSVGPRGYLQDVFRHDVPEICVSD
jgi:hypothetical protein